MALTLLQTVESVLSPQEERLTLPLAITGIALAFLSWSLGEVVMAPGIHAMLPLLWLLYTAGALILVGWYYRISRMLETSWTVWSDGFSAAAWAVAPAHLLLPAGLVARHAGFAGVVVFELIKLGLILVMLQRIMDGLKRLNAWPAWSAMLLAISPLVVCCVTLFLVLMVFGIVMLAGFAGGLS